MTILPKKKSPQSNNGQENDVGESSNGGGVHPQLAHHQLQSSLNNHIQSVGGGGGLNTVHDDRGGLSPSQQHYEDDRSNGASSPSPAVVAAHNKRRSSYRASPLRSVRPKLREHRVGGSCSGGASPPYSSIGTHPIAPHSRSPLSLSTLPTSPLPPPLSPQAGPSQRRNSPAHHHNDDDDDDAANSGYNSGDEYQTISINRTPQEWSEKERWFEKRMKKKGLVIKLMREDGACLFRAIADQVYGDQEMHDVVRNNCMDYLESNKDMFAPFVSEDYETYVARKRQLDVFGNHIEIAAMSELFNRVIEVYCYSPEPINIFQSTNGSENPCIRLSYHRGTHYNSLIDPYNPSYGVGLGLPNLVPGLADSNLMKEATRQSENFHLEQAMLEDKIRATDFEATAEAIEEQVANESYLDYLRDIDKRNKAQHRVGSSSSSSTSTTSPSTQASSNPPHLPSDTTVRPPSSTPPPPSVSPPHSKRLSPPRSHRTSPPHHSCSSPSRSHRSSSTVSSSTPPPSQSLRASSVVVPPSSSKVEEESSSTSAPLEEDLAVPGSSKDSLPRSSSGGGSLLDDKASLFQQLPPNMFGLSDYTCNDEEFDVLAQVLAASQQEYLDSLKRNKNRSNDDYES